jgi:hypothetical protein
VQRHPVGPHMTRRAGRLRSALRPMTRDARLSALHRGDFWPWAALPSPALSSGTRAASSSQPGRIAWRAVPRASRGCGCEPHRGTPHLAPHSGIVSRTRPSMSETKRILHRLRYVVNINTSRSPTLVKSGRRRGLLRRRRERCTNCYIAGAEPPVSPPGDEIRSRDCPMDQRPTHRLPFGTGPFAAAAGYRAPLPTSVIAVEFPRLSASPIGTRPTQRIRRLRPRSIAPRRKPERDLSLFPRRSS